ncbi:MAG TPA: hypothetical protein VGY55_00520 [Pirellulales bacterium]|jgi:hypothetical protein|nr:hypothetical protein [Pirellulales bacterium]
MNHHSGNTTTIPEPSFVIKSGTTPQPNATNLTLGASVLPFDEIKVLLSATPLRLPKRIPKR